MCGIHLIFDKKMQLTPEHPRAFSQMLEASAYRGPDARGTQSFALGEGALHLGSTRLKIIDLNERANQPMTSADGRYHLCFNGTIYNYFDLRNELLNKGVQFTTQSDTEVLLHLLIKQEVAALSRLNGMFSLIFYDQQAQKILIARDRFGMKPLFYVENDQFLIVSSEAKGIISSGLVEKKLHTQAVQDYLCYGYALPPHTFFKNIYQFPAGHYWETIDEGKAKPVSFVNPLTINEEPAEDEVLKATEELLKDAVLNHLVGNTPCGLLLSGGVDSTLLLSLVKELGVHPLPTFSIINSEKEEAFGTNDFRYARKAAEMYGSYHHELTLESQMLNQHQDEFMARMDQPITDSASFMTYMLSAEVKKIAGIALSGAGADELFAGYNRHQAYFQYLTHYDKVIKFSGFLKKSSQWLPTGFSHPLRKRFRLLKKLGQSLDQDPGHTFINFISRSTFLPDCKQRLTLAVEPNTQVGFAENWFHAALEHDLQYYLPADVLALSDNMSMARSLEMRMPYLDLPLADYMRSLPASFRIKHGRKWILNRLLEARGGQIFTRRPKEGFGLPFGQWLRSPETLNIRQALQQKEQFIYGYVSYDQVQVLLQGHLHKKADHGRELWGIWVLSSWLNLHFL